MQKGENQRVHGELDGIHWNGLCFLLTLCVTPDYWKQNPHVVVNGPLRASQVSSADTDKQRWD